MLALLLVGSLLTSSLDGWTAPNSPQATSPITSTDEGVRALLKERCSSCHGPDSEKRKALRKWSDAHDLAATASNPKLIVPGNPDESDLFLAIDFDDMPPEDSDETPLTLEEKKSIFDWIAAGAVVSDPGLAAVHTVDVADAVDVVDVEPATHLAEGAARPSNATDPAPRLDRAKVGKSWMQSTLPRWIGHFHPIVVHFPIALLSVAILAELIARLLRKKSYRGTADFCLVIGILSSFPAAAMGWFLAADTSHRGTELDLHRWLGTSVPILSVAALVLMHKHPKLRIPCFLVLAAVVGATGHLGGALSFGTDWLDWPG